MADTYTLISSVTVGAGGASSIDFTSIPATYTDLVLKISTRRNTAEVWSALSFQVNSDTGTNYSSRILYGTSGSAGSLSTSSVNYGSSYQNANNATSNTFSNVEFYFSNYASNNKKSISIDAATENNGTDNILGMSAVLWNSTSAITGISLYTGTFLQYSTAYLYGIKNS